MKWPSDKINNAWEDVINCYLITAVSCCCIIVMIKCQSATPSCVLLLNVYSYWLFSQVQQALPITGEWYSDAGCPFSRRTHGRTRDASCGFAESHNSTFWQSGWASPVHSATKHCWAGEAQGETATSGHPPSTTTWCDSTSSTRLSPLHCTASYRAWTLAGDGLQPPNSVV